MMRLNKRNIASILFVLISLGCLAQPHPPVIDDPDPTLPIDGGVLIGALVALCYGAKKIIKNN